MHTATARPPGPTLTHLGCMSIFTTSDALTHTHRAGKLQQESGHRCVCVCDSPVLSLAQVGEADRVVHAAGHQTAGLVHSHLGHQV